MTDLQTTTDRNKLVIPDGVPWKMLEELPWRQNSCDGMVADYDSARHVYIAMRPPRSSKRCKEELDWLGFRDVKKRTLSQGTIRNWVIKGDWNRDARLHDMGMCSIEELQRRFAGIRDAALMPLVDSLAEMVTIALEPDRLGKAIDKASEKGDIKGIMDAAETAAKLISYVTGASEQASTPTPQVHQHLHAHVDGAGEDGTAPSPSGALSRVLTPFTRTLDKLDLAAAKKRAEGTAAAKPNGANGKTINGTTNGHAKESDDGEH